jgi:SAM-dependent methyltransferase
MRILSKPFRPWFIIGDNGGQVPLERQYAGLNAVDFTGKSILEIGCAEGLVSIANVRRGARLVHGIEFRERAVEVARSMAGVLDLADRVKFFVGDIRDSVRVLNQAGMLPRYDVVMAMAVLQKVPDQADTLRRILGKCTTTMVLRLGERGLFRRRLIRTAWSWGRSDPVDIAREEGFSLLWESCGYPKGEPPFPLEGDGWLAVFERKGGTARST